MTTDEAYYAVWAQSLAFGYLDHPPLVAWLGRLGLSFLPGAFGLRLASILLAGLQLILLARVARKIFPKQNPSLLVWGSFLFGQVNLYSLVGGTLLTPDLGMIFFWTLTIHEVIYAKEQKKRWFTAGISLGFALLSKYIAILLALAVFLNLLYETSGRILKDPYPWLGLLLAFLVFLPNLAWNAKNDWASVRFQWSHGIHDSHSLEEKDTHPLRILPDLADSTEKKWASYFETDLEKKQKAVPKREKTSLEKFGIRVSDFLAAALGLWGLFALALLLYLIPTKNKRSQLRELRKTLSLVPSNLVFLASTPLLFFAFIALFTKVEGNWPGPYTLAASFLLLPFFIQRPKVWIVAGVLHWSLVFYLAIASRYPVLAPGPASNRLLTETQGFNELSDLLQKESHQPIFTETYQTYSMVKFYRDDLRLQQLPGVSRGSELTRQMLSEQNRGLGPRQDYPQNFLLVLDRNFPARIKGYRLDSLSRYVYCKPGRGFLEDYLPEQPYRPLCPADKKIRAWFLAKYSKV